MMPSEQLPKYNLASFLHKPGSLVRFRFILLYKNLLNIVHLEMSGVHVGPVTHGQEMR